MKKATFAAALQQIDVEGQSVAVAHGKNIANLKAVSREFRAVLVSRFRSREFWRLLPLRLIHWGYLGCWIANLRRSPRPDQPPPLPGALSGLARLLLGGWALLHLFAPIVAYGGATGNLTFSTVPAWSMTVCFYLGVYYLLSVAFATWLWWQKSGDRGNHVCLYLRLTDASGQCLDGAPVGPGEPVLANGTYQMVKEGPVHVGLFVGEHVLAGIPFHWGTSAARRTFEARIPSTEPWKTFRKLSRLVPAIAPRFDSAAKQCLEAYAASFAMRMSVLSRRSSLKSQSARELEALDVKHRQVTHQAHINAAFYAVWDSIVLPQQAREQLVRMTLLFCNSDPAAPRGTLLYGPPGTGKTLVAAKIAEACKAEFFPVSVADLKGSHIGSGAEAAKALWAKAKASNRAIIFVDECDAVFQERGSKDSDVIAKEVLDTFLASWDGIDKNKSVWVIGATNRVDKIDSAIVQRFRTKVLIPLPDDDACERILSLELGKMQMPAQVPKGVGRSLRGLSGRMLETLATNLRASFGARTPLSAEQIGKEVKALKAEHSTATGDSRWDSLVVRDEVLQKLKEIGEIFGDVDFFIRNQIAVPGGLLLYGPPGTGKTEIARTLANEAGLHFVAASTSDVRGQWLGESTQKVASLFARARERTPCILFLDEIDIIAPARTSGGDTFGKEVVGQVLQEMDGVKKRSGSVFVLAATNHLEEIDPAILSRFPTRIEIPLPNREERRRMLHVFLRGIAMADYEFIVWVEKAAEATEGWSGRDLNHFASDLKRMAALQCRREGRDRVEISPDQLPAVFNRPSAL